MCEFYTSLNFYRIHHMESLVENIKNEVSKYKVIIQLFTGLISVLAGILSVITSFLYSPISIAIVCIGVFFIILGVCNKLISAKRESLGVIVDKLSPKQIKILKRIRIGSYALFLIPLYLSVSFFITRNNACSGSKNNIGVIITSFTNSSDDDFSYKLFKVLDTELETMDTVNAERSPKFINAGSTNYQDSIGLLFDHSCYERGLLVFGKRSEQSKLFDCSIFINNVLNLNEQIRVQNKRIINLQNPNLINFSIEDQAVTVSEFILGLLYYTSNNFSLSSKKFQHCSDLASNEENKKLKSQCALFIGNNLLKENEHISAIKQYQLGISYDSGNAYLHFNLGTAFLNTGDSLNAYKHYAVAASLNNKLVNPIRKIELDEIPSERKVIALKENINKQVVLKKSPESENINGLDSISDQNGYTKIRCGNRYGIINKYKDTIIKCDYEYVANSVYVYKSRYYFIVGNNQKYGASNSLGKIEVPIKYASTGEVITAIKTQ